MPDATCTAVLFDIDGTLVDSNYLHVDAWSRALEDVGHPADAWRIHRSIGMDSAQLIAALLGDAADAAGEAAKQRHAVHYERDAERLRAFAHAQDLVRELAARGLQVVLASSATAQEFAHLREVLQVDDAVAASTTSADVETAKPAPDVIGVAMRKAGVEPADAVMIGDAVWDVESAKRAGVRSIGVRSGGVSDAELQRAGAIAVYDDVAHLLRELDASPLFVAAR